MWLILRHGVLSFLSFHQVLAHSSNNNNVHNDNDGDHNNNHNECRWAPRFFFLFLFINILSYYHRYDNHLDHCRTTTTTTNTITTAMTTISTTVPVLGIETAPVCWFFSPINSLFNIRMAMMTTNSHLYASNGHHLTLTRPTTPNDASNHDGNSDGSISSPKYIVFFFLSYLFIHYYHRIAQ